MNLCKLCGSTFGINWKRKIKKHDLCLECFTKQEKKYYMELYCTYDNYCGGCTIYKVMPKTNEYPKRLHQLVHYEYVLPDIRSMDDFSPIKSWSEIWNKCDGWYDKKWDSKFKGKLKKGIYQSTGNGIIAFVLDKKNNMYYVHGCWG